MSASSSKLKFVLLILLCLLSLGGCSDNISDATSNFDILSDTDEVKISGTTNVSAISYGLQFNANNIFVKDGNLYVSPTLMGDEGDIEVGYDTLTLKRPAIFICIYPKIESICWQQICKALLLHLYLRMNMIWKSGKKEWTPNL